MENWPSDRPVDYDADKFWDEESGTWGSDYVAGPGSYVQNLVVIGEDGDIYFGEI